MAASEHIGRQVSVEADPGIDPGIFLFCPVEDEGAGSDKKILILVNHIMSLVVIKMSLSVKYKVKDIVVADDGAIRLFLGTFFISAGYQMEFFGSCLMEHNMFFFHKKDLLTNIYQRMIIPFDFNAILL